jgi:para-nitrobenzyl esterase
MKNPHYLLTILLFCAHTIRAQKSVLIPTPNGELEGVVEASGIHSFKGVPYARPPVGDLRWREPQPVQKWAGVRRANAFGPRAMQQPVYSDMQFRSNGVSEDCLYLNVWTPARSSAERLPVLVYFYGGGFIAGDGSEYRYDGESLAKRGLVTVTVNYRLGVFGFLSHPDLTKESAHHSSGNYGLLDQHAALVWVQQNIAAFGGDPGRVTIAGESAGSMSVCAQVASPLSKGLFTGAIGESGAILGNLEPVALADGEKAGVAFASRLGNKSLSDLRAMSADELLAAAGREERFHTVIDGYFLPEAPEAIFAAGKEMHVPVLAGWNSAEGSWQSILGKEEPTVENYEKAVRRLYGDKADAVLTAYKASSPEEVKVAATNLASDRFIAYSTWKWIDWQSKTGGKPVYRYLYVHPRPAMVTGPANARPPSGAGHSWEIEYALGNLHTNKVYAWNADDDKVSEIMESYFANFIKTGDPNGRAGDRGGAGNASRGSLPVWKPVQGKTPPVMVIGVNTHLEESKDDGRYGVME